MTIGKSKLCCSKITYKTKTQKIQKQNKNKDTREYKNKRKQHWTSGL